MCVFFFNLIDLGRVGKEFNVTLIGRLKNNVESSLSKRLNRYYWFGVFREHAKCNTDAESTVFD